MLYGLGDLAEIMTLSARDFPVELVGVIDPNAGKGEFAGLPVVAAMPDPKDVDAIIICDIREPQASYDEACSNFPAERVLALKFLNVSKVSGDGSSHKGGGQ